jgi:hypothetical protein
MNCRDSTFFPELSSLCLCVSVVLFFTAHVHAGVGDPQIRTDHPWYPGELACSTFERLFATQADVYERVVGVRPTSDEQKALAAWLWRNTHYWHGEEGAEDLWGEGFTRGLDLRSREYWTGMFAHGFGLCGTTHSQWVAEINALLGHNRGRGVGANGHNAFEAFLTGGAYGPGKWVLLDHDLSTVVYDDKGAALLSLNELHKDWKRLTDRNLSRGRQPWLVCGLHPDDAGSYSRYEVAEYLAGYAAVPPMVHLRRGETLRRYFRPGLEDGKTFVFWGRNYNSGGMPGPERSITWVNQPEQMYRSRTGAGYHVGQARFANAVYTYRPDFGNGDYREGVVEERADHVVFEFYSPYIIAATPPNDRPWGIHDAGCRNGLVLHGKAGCAVSVSTDGKRSWHHAGKLQHRLDLTDLVKGHRHYLLRLDAGAAELKGAGLTMITVCQANSSILPRLRDDGTRVQFHASGRAVSSVGPSLAEAASHVIAGKFGSPLVELEVASPRKEPAVAVHAAAHVQSGSPPRPDVRYQIDYSTDGGRSWEPMVKDWTISRRGHEPRDFWSQSLCWGSAELRGPSTVRVRCRNDGGKAIARAEAHLVYRVPRADGTKVTYSWTDHRGTHRASNVFDGGKADPPAWRLGTGRNVQTHWVEFATLPGN